MRALPSVVLRPFTVALLPVVQTWFDHPEVVRWLGGREWPARELEVIDGGPGEVFRGRRVLRTHSWVAYDAVGDPVAKIGGDVYDRWCRYTEGPHGPAIDAVEPGPAMGLAYVVNPRRWRQGFGTATLLAAMDAADVADVVLFAAGVEPDNIASTRCAAAAGLVADSTEPDWEDIVYHVRRRNSALDVHSGARRRRRPNLSRTGSDPLAADECVAGSATFTTRHLLHQLVHSEPRRAGATPDLSNDFAVVFLRLRSGTFLSVPPF